MAPSAGREGRTVGSHEATAVQMFLRESRPPVAHLVGKSRRRTFSLAFKRKILAEADAAAEEPGKIAALVRRHGLYSSHLTEGRRVARDAVVLGLVACRACAPGKRTQTPATQAADRGDGPPTAQVRSNRTGDISRVARTNLGPVACVRQPAQQASAYVCLGRRRGTRPAPERWHPAQPTPPSGRGIEPLRRKAFRTMRATGSRGGGRAWVWGPTRRSYARGRISC